MIWHRVFFIGMCVHVWVCVPMYVCVLCTYSYGFLHTCALCVYDGKGQCQKSSSVARYLTFLETGSLWTWSSLTELVAGQWTHWSVRLCFPQGWACRACIHTCVFVWILDPQTRVLIFSHWHFTNVAISMGLWGGFWWLNFAFSWVNASSLYRDTSISSGLSHLLVYKCWKLSLAKPYCWLSLLKGQSARQKLETHWHIIPFLSEMLAKCPSSLSLWLWWPEASVFS